MARKGSAEAPDYGGGAPKARPLPFASARELPDPDGTAASWLLPVASVEQILPDLGAFSPDGRLVVASHGVFEQRKKKWDTYESWFKWYDTLNGREVASLPGQKNDGLYNPRFSPDGQTIAAVGPWPDKTVLKLF
jgi:hypothetical protein